MSALKKITACFLPSQIAAIKAATGIKLTGKALRAIALIHAGIAGDSMPRCGLNGSSARTKKAVASLGGIAKNKALKKIKGRKNSGLRTKAKK